MIKNCRQNLGDGDTIYYNKNRELYICEFDTNDRIN